MVRNFISKSALLLIIVALSIPCIATAGEAPSDDVKNAGRDGIKFHLKNARIDQGYRNMGFESQDDIDNASLGEGFQIYSINIDKLQDETIPQDIQSLATSRNQWQFLVMAGGKAKALLDVFFIGGKWKTSSIRSAELVSEMSGLMNAYPASAGYRYKFIRVFPVSDFIELSQDGKTLGLFSLEALSSKAGRTAGTFNTGDLLDLQEVLPKLRAIARQNSNSDRAGGLPSENVRQAGRDGIKQKLKGRKHDRRFKDLGFEIQDDIDKAELGEGFRVFTINTKKLLDDSYPLDIQAIVVPTGEWDFLIKADGKASSLMKVAFFDGKWKQVGMGAATLARELGGLLASWPGSDGYTFRYIKVPQTGSDYIELSGKGKLLGIFPLFSMMRRPDRVMGEFKQSDLRDAGEVLSELKDQIKQSIDAYKQKQDTNS